MGGTTPQAGDSGQYKESWPRASKGPCISSASALGRGNDATKMNLKPLPRVIDIQVLSLVRCYFNIPCVKEVVSLF